jgi:hypothetical protein
MLWVLIAILLLLFILLNFVRQMGMNHAEAENLKLKNQAQMIALLKEIKEKK